MKKLTLQELENVFGHHNEQTEKNPYDNPLYAVIVFTGEGWKKPASEYSLAERSYITASNSWGWDWSKMGRAIYGDDLAGSDKGVRLDYYLRGEDKWPVDYCYLCNEKGEAV